MPIYQLYMLLSVLLIIGEVFAPGFILMPIGLAGLITSVIAYFQPTALWLHAVFFICGSGFILLGLARFREQVQTSRGLSQQQDGVVGQTGTIVTLRSEVSPMQVKIFGDIWEVFNADALEKSNPELALGTKVRVVSVQGNKILVEIE